jgi:hypothetical protein
VLERELRAALARYLEFERKAQAGDKAASHELRTARARVLGLSRQLNETDPGNPVLDDVPIELTGDTFKMRSVVMGAAAGDDDCIGDAAERDDAGAGVVDAGAAVVCAFSR